MDDRVRYWIELSDYDLETAEAMLQTGRYLYVGFMCHQAIEKVLKAYFQHIRDSVPPKTHNLRLLADEAGLLPGLPPEHKAFLLELEPLNIETRYPNEKERLQEFLDQQKSSYLIEMTQGLHQWIKEKL